MISWTKGGTEHSFQLKVFITDSHDPVKVNWQCKTIYQPFKLDLNFNSFAFITTWIAVYARCAWITTMKQVSSKLMLKFYFQKIHAYTSCKHSESRLCRGILELCSRPTLGHPSACPCRGAADIACGINFTTYPHIELSTKDVSSCLPYLCTYF